MCGICGSYDYLRQRDADLAVLEAMNETLIHRGPDGCGTHLDGPVALAARRLAIIDIEHGDQPMTTADGTVSVVQNGEILNHLELRAGLECQGVRFRTGCDTEVLPYLYLRDGPEFVHLKRYRRGWTCKTGWMTPLTMNLSPRIPSMLKVSNTMAPVVASKQRSANIIGMS